jgi:hypothetical protein
MYVPKGLATVALRESIDPASLSSILSVSESDRALQTSIILATDHLDPHR